jgi:zinc transport system permease protein
MSRFISDLLTSELVQRAVIAAMLASIACGIVGTVVVVRRITYLAGGIAHCIFGGLGAAVFLSRSYPDRFGWLEPIHGAVAAALIAAFLMGFVSLRFRQREDTVISALWSVGMAAGALLLAMTPGYQPDPMGYLFGSIAIVGAGDVWLLAGLDVLVIGISVAYYRQLQAVCFDPEFARIRGLNVDRYYMLLLCLIALTSVLLVRVVGIVMAIALLTLPVAVAGQFARRLWKIMVLAAAISAAEIMAGLAISYPRDWPPGATTIILAGVVYAVILGGGGLLRKKSVSAKPSARRRGAFSARPPAR